MNVISLDIIDAAYDIDIEYDFKDKAEEDDITRNERTTPVVMFVIRVISLILLMGDEVTVVDIVTPFSIRPSNCSNFGY